MQEEGFVAKLLFPEGQKDVPLGVPMAIIVDNKDDVAKFKDYKPTAAGAAAPVAAPAAPAKKEAAAPVSAKAAAPAQVASQPTGDRVFASPLAKKVAAEGGLNLQGIQGSGPNNRILKSDVEAAL